MNTKPIIQSKVVLTLLAALFVPSVMELAGLNITIEQLDVLQFFFADHVLTLDELIQGIMIIVAGIFRLQTTKRLTLFGRLVNEDTLVG